MLPMPESMPQPPMPPEAMTVPQAPPQDEAMSMQPMQIKSMIRQGLSQMRRLAEENGIDFDNLIAESTRERSAPMPPPPKMVR